MSLYGFRVTVGEETDFGAVLANSSDEALKIIREQVGEEAEVSLDEFTEVLNDQYNGFALLTTGL